MNRKANLIWFHMLSGLRSIRYNKLVAGFTALSYMLGLLLPTAFLSASYQEITQIQNTFMNESNRILMVSDRTQKVSEGSSGDLHDHTHQALIKNLQQLDPMIDGVFFKSEFSGILSGNQQYRYAYIVYVDEQFERNFSKFISEGKWDGASGEKECVLGTELARNLWSGGSIGKQIRVNGMTCRVTGETEVYEDRILMRAEQVKGKLKGQTQYFVKLHKHANIEFILSKIRQLGGSLQVEQVDEHNKNRLKEAYGVFSILIMLSLIVLVFSLLNIHNIIDLLFRERESKYGIQMALGSTRRGLFFEFYFELYLVTSASLIVVYCILYGGKEIIAYYLFPISLHGSILLSILVLNGVISAILCRLYMKRLAKESILTFIRGSHL